MFFRQGLSTITIILILALFLLTVSILAFNSAINTREDREIVRLNDLQTIVSAQENYYDQYKRYASSVQDLSRFLKYLLPSDPKTNKNYMVFVNQDGQEWCAAAQSEIVANQYFIQNSSQSSIINHLPVNVVTCK